MAGLVCIDLPFGTALAVLTFIVLMRGSIKRVYERPAVAAATASAGA